MSTKVHEKNRGIHIPGPFRQAGQADDLRWNAAYDNVFVNSCEVLRGRWTTNSTDVSTMQLPPGDRNAACRGLVPGFQPIPYEKIGRRQLSK